MKGLRSMTIQYHPISGLKIVEKEYKLKINSTYGKNSSINQQEKLIMRIGERFFCQPRKYRKEVQKQLMTKKFLNWTT